MQGITSVQNPHIRALRALKEKKERDASGRFIVEGRKMVEEALAHATVYSAVVEERRQEGLQPLLHALQAANVPVWMVPRRVLEAVCDTKSPQGIAAAVGMPSPNGVTAGKHWIALDGVQDPGNVGTMLRTADAAGFAGMILGPTCADIYGSKALRATMGAVFRLPVTRAQDLAELLAAWRHRGYAILSSQLDGQDFYARDPLPERCVLVIGSEGEGVSEPVRALATHRMALPMRGGTESLNAAVAAGIMMYELIYGQGGCSECK